MPEETWTNAIFFEDDKKGTNAPGGITGACPIPEAREASAAYAICMEANEHGFPNPGGLSRQPMAFAEAYRSYWAALNKEL